MRLLSKLVLPALALAAALAIFPYHLGGQRRPDGVPIQPAAALEPAPEASGPRSVPEIQTTAGQPEASPKPALTGQVRVVQPPPAHGPAGVPGPGATAGPPPLQGAEDAGELTVDARGRFVPDRKAVALFDHFLEMNGEMPLGAIRARIRAEIEARLAPAAAAEAIALLDAYLHYRRKAAAMLRGTLTSPDLRAAMERVRRLRSEVFGASAAEALFGGRNTAGTAALEVRKLLQDPAMPRAALDAALRQYDAVLPPSARAKPAEPLAPPHLLHAEESLRRHGAAAAEIQALRERLVGPEAALRLSEQEQSGGEWQQRYDAYQASRRATVADASLGPAERQRALEALLSESFAPEERPRVEVQARREQSRALPRP